MCAFCECANNTFELVSYAPPLFNGRVCLDLVVIIAIVCSEWFTCIGGELGPSVQDVLVQWDRSVPLSVLGCCSHLYLFAGFSPKQTRASHVEHRLCLWAWARARSRRARGGLGDEYGISPLLQVSFGFMFSQPPTQIETRSACERSTQARPLDSWGMCGFIYSFRLSIRDLK